MSTPTSQAERTEAAIERKKGKYRPSSCMLAIMVEGTHIQWKLDAEATLEHHPAAPEIAGDHRIKADKDTQGPGRARKLLALALKKGQEMGKKGRCPCHCSTTLRCLGIEGMKHH